MSCSIGRGFGVALFAVGLALVGMLASCDAAGPSSGLSGSSGLPLPVPDVGDATAVEFLDCTEDIQPVLPVPVPPDRVLRYECADIPIEPDHLAGTPRQSSIGLMRISLADQPPGTKPPLLILDDSDSETGSLRAARLSAQVPLSLLRHFDMVGLDRRGEGTSRLDCFPDRTRAELIGADLTDQNGVDALLRQARDAISECGREEGAALSRYGTATTARDIDRARQLLGVRTLSGIGFGDGATAMALWARQTPASVGRIVLDSPPDPTQDEIAAADARATAAEATFDAFAKDCHSRADCPLGPDPRADLTTLATGLRTKPMPTTAGEPLTSGALLNTVLIGLDDPAQWSALAASIADARNGDANGLLARLDDLTGLNGRFDLAMATRCNDSDQHISPLQVTTVIKQWQDTHPLFGTVLAQQLLYCSTWPPSPHHTTTDLPSAAPPILVLATALSPRALSTGHQRGVDQLTHATLITGSNTGRDAYPRDTCATNIADRFWLDGTSPQTNTRCR